MNPRSDGDKNEELKYNILGQDFIYDLLFCLDAFRPMVIVIEKLQGLMVPIWKTRKWLSTLITFWQSIDINSLHGLPLLKQHMEDIANMKYRDCSLVEGYLVVRLQVQEDSMESSPEEPATKKRKVAKKKTSIEWEAREI